MVMPLPGCLFDMLNSKVLPNARRDGDQRHFSETVLPSREVREALGEWRVQLSNWYELVSQGMEYLSLSQWIGALDRKQLLADLCVKNYVLRLSEPQARLAFYSSAEAPLKGLQPSELPATIARAACGKSRPSHTSRLHPQLVGPRRRACLVDVSPGLPRTSVAATIHATRRRREHGRRLRGGRRAGSGGDRRRGGMRERRAWRRRLLRSVGRVRGWSSSPTCSRCSASITLVCRRGCSVAATTSPTHPAVQGARRPSAAADAAAAAVRGGRQGGCTRRPRSWMGSCILADLLEVLGSTRAVQQGGHPRRDQLTKATHRRLGAPRPHPHPHPHLRRASPMLRGAPADLS